MLFLVGAGLEAGDISVRAVAQLKKAKQVMIDIHTNRVSDAQIAFLEKELSRKLITLERSDLEEKIAETIGRAKEEDIAIITMGDPLIATTHHIILDEAAKLGIQVQIFHATSIFSAAIGSSGLDIYRFGPTTTIPFWMEHYRPASFIDVIARNLENGEHTLVLLDYDYKEGKAMDLPRALSILAEAEKGKQNPVMNPKRKALILGGVGTNGEAILYTEIGNAAALASSFSGKLVSIIVPAKPNFAEEESLKRFTASST